MAARIPSSSSSSSVTFEDKLDAMFPTPPSDESDVHSDGHSDPENYPSAKKRKVMAKKVIKKKKGQRRRAEPSPQASPQPVFTWGPLCDTLETKQTMETEHTMETPDTVETSGKFRNLWKKCSFATWDCYFAKIVISQKWLFGYFNLVIEILKNFISLFIFCAIEFYCTRKTA
jgi:hypothetical protein